MYVVLENWKSIFRNAKGDFTMAKRIIILVALLVMVAGSAVQAQVGVDASIDFVSKYMWYGYDVYDDHGAYQPSVSYTFVETDMGSFGGKIWGSMPFGSGNENGMGTGLCPELQCFPDAG